jgi:copper(I)-binding protein
MYWVHQPHILALILGAILLSERRKIGTKGLEFRRGFAKGMLQEMSSNWMGMKIGNKTNKKIKIPI